LSVARGRNSPEKLWGQKAARLVVVIATHSDGSPGLFAYGVDPEDGALLFAHSFAEGGLGEFLRFVVDGSQHHAFSNAVEYPNPPLEPPGPKANVVIHYAQAVRADEVLAQVSDPTHA